MTIKKQILLVLNSDKDFFSSAEKYFGETGAALAKAIPEIILVTISATYIQCILNARSEEICRIAKECSLVNFRASRFMANSPSYLKSNGVNSELFADRFDGVVKEIAELYSLKSSSVKGLFSIITPLVLSKVYFRYRAENFTISQLDAFLLKQAGLNKLKPRLKELLSELAKNEFDRFITKPESFLTSLKQWILRQTHKFFEKKIAKVN